MVVLLSSFCSEGYEIIPPTLYIIHPLSLSPHAQRLPFLIPLTALNASRIQAPVHICPYIVENIAPVLILHLRFV